MNFSFRQYLDHEARIARGRHNGQPAKIAQGCTQESVLHDEIIQFCKAKGWIAFHGSMAHKTMRTIGENDFHLLLPNGIVLFIECKTKTGKLTTEQLGLSHWMDKLGHKMHVVRSMAEFIEIVDRLKLEQNSENSKSFPLQELPKENLTGNANATVEMSRLEVGQSCDQEQAEAAEKPDAKSELRMDCQKQVQPTDGGKQ